MKSAREISVKEMKSFRGRVWEYVRDKFHEGVHMTLIDPEKVDGERAARIASEAYAGGTDAFMVGGSIGFDKEKIDEVVLSIKEAAEVPVIIFPSGADRLSEYADAIYFMSLMNSSDVRMVVREQVRGAKKIKEMGLEVIPMGYVVVEPGMTVGKVGKAELITRDKKGIEDAVSYGIAAQFFGMRLFYLEAGSGAPDPVPEEMVKAVRREIGIGLVVGGGIRRREQARKLRIAGADVIVTGTIVEEVSDVENAIREIVKGVKGI